MNILYRSSSLSCCAPSDVHNYTGAADIYPRFGPTSQWDTAAAQCILQTAGGAVTDLDNVPLGYGLERPILNPEFVAVGDTQLQKLVSASDP